MTVQITGRQIANAAVDVNKLDLSTGTFDFTSAVLQAATPTQDSHAATKAYVDGIAQGLNWKDSVRAATTANITLSGTQTIDGISIVADDRVLVKDQSTASENGIYICKSGSWVRADDMDAADEFSGAAVFIQEGTVNADTGYVCTNNGDITVGTDAVSFTQFTGAGQITAGDGLAKNGATLSVNVDDSSLEISADALQVKSGGITNAMLAGSIANSKLANSTISGVALGGSLGSLSAGNGLSMTSYDGSAAVSDLTIDLDGATLSVGVDGLKVADAGIGASQIADGAIDASDKIADGIISSGKIADGAVTSGKIADGAINAAGKIADGVITAPKLAGSIPADKLNLGNGLLENGGNLEIDLDGASLALGANGIKIANAGVSTVQLADNAISTAKLGSAVVTEAKLANLSVATGKLQDDCVTNAKIADDAVQTENLNFAGFFSAFDADGSTAAFEMQASLDLAFAEFFVVTVNGLIMEYKETPDSQDNYKIANDGTGGVAKITFGSNLANGDRVTIRGFVNN